MVLFGAGVGEQLCTAAKWHKPAPNNTLGLRPQLSNTCCLSKYPSKWGKV
jgi:hypothetical protein